MDNTDNILTSDPSAMAERQDRRRHSRGGLFSRLEDITYGVLRGDPPRSRTVPAVSRLEVPMNTLAIVVRNDLVVRVRSQTQTWLIHRPDGTTRAIDVDHYYDGAPFVVTQFQIVS